MEYFKAKSKQHAISHICTSRVFWQRSCKEPAGWREVVPRRPYRASHVDQFSLVSPGGPGAEEADRRQLLLFLTSPNREEAAARCPAPEPSLPAQEGVHTRPPRHQPHVCLLCTTLHPPVLQNFWQDGSWLHQGLGPWGKSLGGPPGFSGLNLAHAGCHRWGRPSDLSGLSLSAVR